MFINQNAKHHFKNGFTLIELLISTSLTVLLMMGITSLFMTFLLGSAKTNTRKTVKEEGVQALSQIEFLIKNAAYVDTDIAAGGFPCNGTDQNSIKIISLDSGSTIFSKAEDTKEIGNPYKISSSSATPPTDAAFLTSSGVTIVGDGPTFNCSGTVGNRKITIEFTLEKTTPDGTVTETFNSTVNMRN